MPVPIERDERDRSQPPASRFLSRIVTCGLHLHSVNVNGIAPALRVKRHTCGLVGRGSLTAK